jgi:hypothetical protein
MIRSTTLGSVRTAVILCLDETAHWNGEQEPADTSPQPISQTVARHHRAPFSRRALHHACSSFEDRDYPGDPDRSLQLSRQNVLVVLVDRGGWGSAPEVNLGIPINPYWTFATSQQWGEPLGGSGSTCSGLIHSCFGMIAVE